MIVTVLLLLVLAAFVCTLVSASGRYGLPLWVAVLLLTLAELARLLPVR